MTTAMLFHLPTELLLSIATYLDIPSTAALSLTCHRMYSMLTEYKWTTIKAIDTPTHLSLLDLISRDDPNWTLCQSCQSLHSTKESPRLRDQNLVRKSQQTDIDAEDLIPIGLKITAPVPPPTPTTPSPPPKILLELLQAHKQLVELRGSRYDPSGLFNKGMCLQLLALDEHHHLSLPPSDHLPPLAANITYTTTPKLHQEAANLMLQTTIHISLLHPAPYSPSTSTSKSPPPPCPLNAHTFHQLRRVLACLNLKCCLHCTPEQMTDDIVCKLEQYIAFSSACACSLWQPERACRRHKHDCGCRAEVQVGPKGVGCVEVRVWREWAHWGRVGRGSGRGARGARGEVKRRFFGGRGGGACVNAVW